VNVDAAGKSASGDQQLAFCIHGACKNEIAIATFAQDRLQTEAAKQFAAKMVKEHSAGCEKVGQIAGNLVDHSDHAAPGGDRPDADRPAAAPRRESGEGEEPAAPRAGVKVDAGEVEVQAGGARRAGARAAADVEVRAGAAGGHVDWIAIHKELGQKCLESTKKELAKHEGMDFDQAFMGQQLLAHMEMVDKLSVFKNHASPQLRQVIDSELQMATNHLNEARQIMEQMKDTETPPRTARRPGSPDAEDRPTPKSSPERRPE
jgi:predicted outer membrane protein